MVPFKIQSFHISKRAFGAQETAKSDEFLWIWLACSSPHAHSYLLDYVLCLRLVAAAAYQCVHSFPSTHPPPCQTLLHVSLNICLRPWMVRTSRGPTSGWRYIICSPRGAVNVAMARGCSGPRAKVGCADQHNFLGPFISYWMQSLSSGAAVRWPLGSTPWSLLL